MEDMNTVLGVREENKPKNYDVDLSNGDNNAESIATILAYFVLIGGLLTSVIIGIIIGQDEGTKEGWKFFIETAIEVIAFWALSLMFINISINLRTIKHLLAKGKE